jgi:ABC-type lipoprotein release transport system permease subunit
LIWAVVVSVIASLVGSLYPALKAARHDALEALAYE